ncbi:hypothetical protein [uncultured Chryseobacterium sp.]|uniref:hypothetical protein n=1 Tax=uncultured Chryseobacterium sp. TaxID=259322 RepID=UPI0025F018F9|nr:hypothetical protein [uncultured Chryseobacterium sp.]
MTFIQTNKILILKFLLCLIIGCKKNIDKQNILTISDTRKVKKADPISTHINDSIKIQDKSFVISCGTSCAVTYTANQIIKDNFTYKVTFNVDMYINEELAETYKEIYSFVYDDLRNINKIILEGTNQNALETLPNGAKKTFIEFSKILLKTMISQNDKNVKELIVPFCLKIDTLPKSNYYQTNLDTFLLHHNIAKTNELNLNTQFHKNTEDFVSDKQANFMHYPFNGNAFAIRKLKVSNTINAVFYTYLFDSEIIQPRIEIQTFDDKQTNIDNLIIASTFSSECSGYRDFCIDKHKIITINNYYYCDGIEYKNLYKYKISNSGKFVLSE